MTHADTASPRADGPQRMASVPPQDADGEGQPRILMVLKRTGGRGGLQLQARRVTRQMVRMGLTVRMLGHERRAPKKVPSWHRGIPVTHLRAAGQWSFALRLYRWLVDNRDSYDVVHVHGFGIDTFAAIAAKRATRKPLIVKPSTAGKGTKLHVYAQWTRVLPLLKTLGWNPVDAWVSISDQTRDDLLLMGIPAHKIISTPNGVNFGRFKTPSPEVRAACREEFGVGPEDRVIMTVARLTEHKRVDAVIRAFQTLVQENPHLRLWVVGCGEKDREFHALAQSGPGADRVQFFEHVSPRVVARRMQAADLFTLLSRWEGLSNALLEAMACGLPPVVTDVSGMRDVVSDRENGLVVPLDNDPATAAAYRELLQDNAYRAQLGQAAAGTIQSRYGLDSTVNRLLSLYGACIRGTLKPAPRPSTALTGRVEEPA